MNFYDPHYCTVAAMSKLEGVDISHSDKTLRCHRCVPNVLRMTLPAHLCRLAVGAAIWVI